MSKWGKAGVILSIAALIAAAIVYNSESFRNARFVDSLIARNIAARGGMDAWEAIRALRMSGQMDLGQGLSVPYTLEQMRPGRMCFEFEFAEETATQCVDGDDGWKNLPFRNRRGPEPMTEQEVSAMADFSDIDGMLFNAAQRGIEVEYIGEEVVDGRSAHKLHVRAPGGGERWIYLDQETSLELMVETTRMISGELRHVYTKYEDWQASDGILIPRYQDTQTEGRSGVNFLTVESVTVNPLMDDSRFRMPVDAVRTAQANQ